VDQTLADESRLESKHVSRPACGRKLSHSSDERFPKQINLSILGARSVLKPFCLSMFIEPLLAKVSLEQFVFELPSSSRKVLCADANTK
jgi:hypothetical protein